LYWCCFTSCFMHTAWRPAHSTTLESLAAEP
jgi:hypothetical protein